MLVLALVYWMMNILSFAALQFISAATFTILSQCKVFTTAAFSSLMLHQRYSWGKWRALAQLMLGVVLFSAPVFEADDYNDKDVRQSQNNSSNQARTLLGTAAVLLQMTLSGFSSIYFEKAIKSDSQQLSIWECNFQIALGSLPIYCCIIWWNNGGEGGGDWSYVTIWLSILGAAGGLLVALSIKYADSVMKTLAVTGSIVLSSYLDHVLLSGPMNMIMIIAASQVILAICNYTFDSSSVNTGMVLHEVETAQAKNSSRAFDKLEECDSLINEESRKEVEEE
jgi:UDP-sugar transporter A1/2/3